MRDKLLPFSPPSIGEEEIKEVVDTLKSGWITTGPKTKKFEEEFAEYIGCKYAVALNSCTAGIFLSLLVGGVKEGDEVITSPYTYTATVNVIMHLGAKPVFADVQRDTFNIDPEEIKKKITKKTKAIIPVHLGGRPCDMESIGQIAKKYHLLVIEDAAHAVGAKYKNKMIGNISDTTCFSLHAVKNLTTAEGGMLTTNNKIWADKIRLMSNDGIEKGVDAGRPWFYKVIYPGYRFNLTDIASSIGLWQLRRLEQNYKIRQRNFQLYRQGLKEIEGIELPESEIDGRHSLHLFPILLKDNYLKINADQFILALKKENISSNVHFIPIYFHPYYKEALKYKKGDFPNTEYLFNHEITLPFYLSLSEKDIQDVITAIKKIVSENQNGLSGSRSDYCG